MTTPTFRLTYDGPAMAESQMDVRDLAPALLAMGDLLEASTRVLYGDRVKSRVDVRGAFRTGSFGIDFSLATDWLRFARDIFAGDNASAAANAIEILGLLGVIAWKGGGGLLGLLKQLRGRKITKVEVIGEGCSRLCVDDECYEVETRVLNLLRDVGVRTALDQALAPLDREGVDTFAVGGEDNPLWFVIHNDERWWFRTPEVEDLLLIFKEDNKWRLHDGAATIHAVISDEEFLSGVNHNRISFTKGDILICTVRVRQRQTQSGARTDYEVTRVLEHRSAAMQLPLF